MIFAIVFGLSMDYEVFLVSRIHEEWERTGDPAHAVREGLAATGRVITAAAAIMIVVFAAFILSPSRMLQQFGLGLAVAVLLDAVVIRCLIVPAIMQLLGRWAWWLPGPLARRPPARSLPAPRRLGPRRLGGSTVGRPRIGWPPTGSWRAGVRTSRGGRAVKHLGILGHSAEG